VLFTRQDNYHNDASPVVTEFLGHALVVANGSSWKMQRKTLQPAFKSEYIREMFPIFQKNIATLVEKYRKCAKAGETVDAFTTAKQMNFDISKSNNTDIFSRRDRVWIFF
jgi:cytochrome P450